MPARSAGSSGLEAPGSGFAVASQPHVSRQTGAVAELDLVLDLIVHAAAQLAGADMAAVSLLLAGGEELEVIRTFGTMAPIHGVRLDVAQSFQGLAAHLGKAVRTTDVLRDRRQKDRGVARLLGARGMLVVPLRSPTAVCGTLAVAKTVPWRFSNADAALLASLAESASAAIHSARACCGLRRTSAATKAGWHPQRCPHAVRCWREVEQSTQRPATVEPLRLSTRQLGIVRLLMSGKTTNEIAATVGLSPRTVQHYVERLKARFNQPRLSGLIAHFARAGL